MGAKTIDFVTKTLTHVRANPQFLPPFLDVAEFERDLADLQTLRELQGPLSQIMDMLVDTMLMSGSETTPPRWRASGQSSRRRR